MDPEQTPQFEPEPNDDDDLKARESARLDPEFQLHKRVINFATKGDPDVILTNFTDQPEFLWPEELSDQLEAAREYLKACNEKLAVVGGFLELQIKAALECEGNSYLAVSIQTKHPKLALENQERFALPTLPPIEQVRFTANSSDLVLEHFDRPVILLSNSTEQWQAGKLPTLIILEAEFESLLKHGIAHQEEISHVTLTDTSPSEFDALHNCQIHRIIREGINGGSWINEGNLFEGEYHPEIPDAPALIQSVSFDRIDDKFVIANVQAKHRVPDGSVDYVNINYAVAIAYDELKGTIFTYSCSAGIGRLQEVGEDFSEAG